MGSGSKAAVTSEKPFPSWGVQARGLGKERGQERRVCVGTLSCVVTGTLCLWFYETASVLLPHKVTRVKSESLNLTQENTVWRRHRSMTRSPESWPPARQRLLTTIP